MSGYKSDIIDLFSGKRGGHVQKWLYLDITRPDESTGSSLWSDFVSSNKNYYTIRNEIDLIPALVRHLKKDYDSIVDFGIGSNSAVDFKTAPIIQSQKGLKRYTAIDVSKEEIDHGLQYLKSKIENDNIDYRGVCGDFYKTHSIQGNHKLGLCLGGTITNEDMIVGGDFPESKFIDHIKTMARTTHGSGRSEIILSADTNPDLQAAQDSYLHQSWVRMMTGLLYDVQSQLNPKGDFQPSMWHYVPVIDRDNHVLQQAVSPSVDQSFEIDGHEFNVKKGDLFVAINLFKLPLDLFIDLAEKSGLENCEPIRSDDHSMVMLEASV